jgi:hypothetical protein
MRFVGMALVHLGSDAFFHLGIGTQLRCFWRV